MQIDKDSDLYDIIKAVLIWVPIVATLGWFVSCQLIPQLAPEDWAYNPPATVNEPDTCESYELITEPAFVTLWLEFDTEVDSILWQGGGVESYDLNDVLQALTSYPTTIYNKGRKWAVIVDGTTDANYFKLKIFAKYYGRKVYMTPDIQGFVFGGALTFDEFRDVAIKYPSVKIFNFRSTFYDSLQYIELANIILGDCKAGRDWADFRFNQYPMDTAIISQFINAGWNNVLD